MALRKVKLYGKLGQIFGREWNLDVNSVGEAIKAIDINTNNRFSQYLLKNGTKKYYKVCVKNKKNTISKEEIGTSFGNGDIYITPIISGSDKRAIGQIILGVVMVVAAYYGGGFEQGGSSFFQIVGTMGISMILGGVAQLLAPNPNAKSTDQRNSYLFQGNATTVYQGTAVGLVYGRALVPPMPVCISTDTNDISTYEGAIVNLGKVGILDDSLLLYSYKGGTAFLCGFDEWIASTPPKAYKTATEYYSCYYRDECTSIYQGVSTRTIINDICTITDGVYDYCNGVSGPVQWSWNAVDVRISDTPTIRTITNCCYVNGYGIIILSEEDTELDAIARLMNSTSWSAWQTDPIYPYYQSRTDSIYFRYFAVKTKSITLPDKYNPSFTYKYSITLQRRAYGSSDPWVDAETMQTNVTPLSDGTLVLPEVELNNVSGYETKIKNASLNY